MLSRLFLLPQNCKLLTKEQGAFLHLKAETLSRAYDEVSELTLINLFLALLGLCYCSGLSTVREWGLLSGCGARVSQRGTSFVVEHAL